MSRARGLGSAIVWGALVATAAWSPRVEAQVPTDVIPLPVLTFNPVERNPRLLGLGGITLVIDEQHNRINLWDFAANPAGVLDADSASAVELGSIVSSKTNVRDLMGGVSGRERQNQGGGDFRVTYEAWRREPGSMAFGLIGDAGDRRSDEPIGPDIERRNVHRDPNATVIIAGALPMLANHMRYAVRISTAYHEVFDQFRSIVTNAAGEYVDKNGGQVGPPNLFAPDDYTVRALGAGASVAAGVGDVITAAVGFDYVGNNVFGTNEGARHVSEVSEKRPYRIIQGTLLGKVGRSLEWGVDGRGWRADSDQEWVFSISSGFGSLPFAGRGKLLDRREEGSLFKGRARWTSGNLELGLGAQTAYQRVRVRAPNVNDPFSFNHFRNLVVHRPGADSLALPDSVVNNTTAERAWDFGGAAAWKLRRGVVGVEGHMRQDRVDQELAGGGPKRVGWDIRGGVEYELMRSTAVRTGYIHRWYDRDDFTEQTESLANTWTLGLGLHRPTSGWRIEAGYAIEWSQADYGNPTEPHGSRQLLESRIHWAF